VLRTLKSKRTKIVATIGPASSDPETIRAMIRAGMDVARINFSHGDHATHAARIATIRRIAQEEKAVVAILGDIQGPKIRIGQIVGEEVLIKPGDTVTFTLDDVPGENLLISLPHPEFVRDIAVGTDLLLDDGNLELKVREVGSRSLICEVVIGGMLKSRKGVSAPNARLTLSAITEKDRKDIEFALKERVDYLAMSFVRSSDDIRQMRWLMNLFGGDAAIIAKIELREALTNMEAILEVSDGIMVARGDLGVETPAQSVPYEQKRIIQMCNRAGKPVITATQMLESMRSNPRPTRAEASDVYNAILDGTDAVMLSAESASGDYPVRAVEMMATIANTAEEHVWSLRTFSRQRVEAVESGADSISNAIGEATVSVAEALNPAAIITTTLTGYTTRRVARERPRTPIICMTPNEVTYRRMALVWGVIPLLIQEFATIDEMIGVVVRAAHDAQLVHRGDTILIIAGVPFGVMGQTNLMKVHRVGEAGEI